MHRLSIRVYYEDTDFGGVVYYANYMKFIERGRTEALRALGVDQVALKAAGLIFVVRRMAADWLAPARFDDLVEVRSEITEVGGASVRMVQEVRRGDAALFRATVQVACMDPDGRARRLPAEVRARLLAPGAVPNDATDDAPDPAPPAGS